MDIKCFFCKPKKFFSYRIGAYGSDKDELKQIVYISITLGIIPGFSGINISFSTEISKTPEEVSRIGREKAMDQVLKAF